MASDDEVPNKNHLDSQMAKDKSNLESSQNGDDKKCEPTLVYPHNFCMTSTIYQALLCNCRDVIQPSIRQALKPGIDVWDLALSYHQTHNEHHNYFTENEAVAQEIALDFFSSALVSCQLVKLPITPGRVKKAYSNILTWTNYINSSAPVKNSVELVKRALYEEYNVTNHTENEQIPKKPYNYNETEKRYATLQLMQIVETAFDARPTNHCVLESDLLMKIIEHLVNQSADDAGKAWIKIIPCLFKETEVGKWISEIYYHKKLVVHFHNINKRLNQDGRYVVEDRVAISHDDDKYIPFQIMSYALKWYYNNNGIYRG